MSEQFGESSGLRATVEFHGREIGDRKRAEDRLHERIDRLEAHGANERKELAKAMKDHIDEKLKPVDDLKAAVTTLTQLVSDIAPQVRFTSRFWKWCAGILAVIVAAWFIASFVKGGIPTP